MFTHSLDTLKDCGFYSSKSQGLFNKNLIQRVSSNPSHYFEIGRLTFIQGGAVGRRRASPQRRHGRHPKPCRVVVKGGCSS